MKLSEAFVKEVLKQYQAEEISFGKMVELINEEAAKPELRIGVIGPPSKLTLIEHLVEGVEKATGQKVVIVNVHSKDMEFLTKEIGPKVEPFILKAEDFSDEYYCDKPKKRKGHERPYKYHK